MKILNLLKPARTGPTLSMTGQSLTEYGLVVGLVVVVSIAALSTLGTSVRDTLDNVNQVLTSSGTPRTTNGGGSPGNGNANNGGVGNGATIANGSETSGSNGGSFPATEAPPEGVGGNTGVSNGGVGGGTSSTREGENTENANPGGTSMGSTQPETSSTPANTTEQQYQAFLAANPQTAQIINQLSPDGQQKINDYLKNVVVQTQANGVQTDAGTPRGIYNYVQENLSSSDRGIFYQSISNMSVGSE